MADSTVHALTDGTTPASTDEFYVSRSPYGAGNDVKLTWAELVAAVKGSQLAAVAQAGPADPASTTSTTGAMMGLAGSITPNSTRIYVIIRGAYWNVSASTTIQAKYGTGAAPVNGAAATGTNVGNGTGALYSASGNPIPFAVGGVVTGLTPGTTYWLDIDLLTSSAGSAANLRNITIDAFDII